MNEYGWELMQVLGHTQYQLKSLAYAISKRTSLKMVSLANVIRAAYGADQAGYQEFIDSLMQFNGQRDDTNQQFL